MKYIIFFFIFFICCKAKKENLSQMNSLELGTISADEKKIVNDFLIFEFASNKYKNYQDYDKILIDKAENGLQSINAYEYAYKDWHSLNEASKDDNNRLGWFLDTIQIRKLKQDIETKKMFIWKKTDFEKINFKLIKSDSIKILTEKGVFINSAPALLIKLSKPIIFKANYALITFAVRNTYGHNEIYHSTSLLKKINGNWVVINDYWDGMMN
jgi:hypothetical protein